MILKEIVNTVPIEWFKSHSAKRFSLRMVDNHPSIVFSLNEGGGTPLQAIISFVKEDSYEIIISSEKQCVSKVSNVFFKNIGKTLIDSI